MTKSFNDLIDLTKYLASGTESSDMQAKKKAAYTLIPELQFFELCYCNHKAHNHHNIFEHTIAAMMNLKKYVNGNKFTEEEINTMMICSLLHDIGKMVSKTIGKDNTTHFLGHPVKSAIMAQGILNRFDIDEQTKRQIVKIIAFHDTKIATINHIDLYKMINIIGLREVGMLLRVQRADFNAHAECIAFKKEHLFEQLENMHQTLENSSYTKNRN